MKNYIAIILIGNSSIHIHFDSKCPNSALTYARELADSKNGELVHVGRFDWAIS